MANHKKRFAAGRLLLILLPVMILIVFALLVKTQLIRVNHLFIKENSIIGADISRYQADVDMKELAGEGIRFVYIKATEGSSHTDERFSENREKAEAAGMPAGAYHFFSMDSSGATQAQHYIEFVGDLTDSLYPAVDVEFYGDKQENPPPKDVVRQELHTFLDLLEETYRVKPVIYCSWAILNTYIDESFDEYPFWIRSVYAPVRLATSHDWVIWQYTDHGRVAGYTGGETYIDLDVLHPDMELEDIMIESEEQQT